nr:hypothetical protein [uncultured Chryseobacterium sp.]
MENLKVQAKINELKTQSTAGGEKGVKFKTDGTPSATITGGAHSVNFGDKTGYTGEHITTILRQVFRCSRLRILINY